MNYTLNGLNFLRTVDHPCLFHDNNGICAGIKLELVNVNEKSLRLVGWLFGAVPDILSCDDTELDFAIVQSARKDVSCAYAISERLKSGFEIHVNNPPQGTYVLSFNFSEKWTDARLNFFLDIPWPANKISTQPTSAATDAALSYYNWGVRDRAPNAAVTIVSKNYFSYAITLAESYKKHHINNDFIIALVDRSDDAIPATLDCGAEVVEIERFKIPDIERMIYRYNVMELNTAVKPFILNDLLKLAGYETLLYIDPDIWIFQPMTEVYKAFDLANIILTPHIMIPYEDGFYPSDKSILQSGTYNLGFLGIKKSQSVEKLLDWWMSKLYADCIVDIPQGLFVDQKWIDLIPGFFPDHTILYDPTYNVAYWNLHERLVTGSEGNWRVNDLPLTFFHFSGFSPFCPEKLSKHQNRHDVNDNLALKLLLESYAAQLLLNGYEEFSSLSYSYEKLPNGVHVPLDIVRDVMQWAIHNHVKTPDPIYSSEEFCKFLMSRNIVPQSTNVVLLYYFIVKKRSDIMNSFPDAIHNSDDTGFREWLSNSGLHEYKIKDMISFEDKNQITDYVDDLFSRLKNEKRDDIFQLYKEMWNDESVFDEFYNWVTFFGIKEMGFENEHALQLKRARSGIFKILNIYFLRGDLQCSFHNLLKNDGLIRFVSWLHSNKYILDLTNEEISLFERYAASNEDLIEKMRFLYQHHGNPSQQSPSIYAIDEQRYLKNISYPTRGILDWLSNETEILPIDHYVSRFGRNFEFLNDSTKCSVPNLSQRQNFMFLRSLKNGIDLSAKDSFSVNLAGFLSAATGMGQSSRSMKETLSHAHIHHHSFILPNPRTIESNIPTRPTLFGWPSSAANISITVANADSCEFVESMLPSVFWTKRNIGYWVWETEKLPDRFKKSQELYDEIWTPSAYSANAIKRTVDIPVHVLPHTLDFDAIKRSKPNRKKFGLPNDGILYGFIFDPSSDLERKNVAGLVRTFNNVFRKDDNCFLILKSNGRSSGIFQYEMLRAQSKNSNILFYEATLTREETHEFIKSLDVYVSLHRAEGFGLSCAEAMAHGLPVVATDYSGNLEFMNVNNSLLVPANVVETERSYGPYLMGTRWGDPNLDAAGDMMRLLLQYEKRRALGSVAAKSIEETLSPKRIGEIVKELINESSLKTL